MNWINNLFYMGLLTTLTGSLAFVVYVAAAGILDRLKKYRYIYGMLLLVFPFWLFPGLYLFLYVTHYRKTGEILFVKGHLFELTPTIAYRACGSSCLAAGCRNRFCQSCGSLLQGGTLYKKASNPSRKTGKAGCRGDKTPFKNPGKYRSVSLLRDIFANGAGVCSKMDRTARKGCFPREPADCAYA